MHHQFVVARTRSSFETQALHAFKTRRKCLSTQVESSGLIFCSFDLTGKAILGAGVGAPGVFCLPTFLLINRSALRKEQCDPSSL